MPTSAQVNFATADWLPYGRNALACYARHRRTPVFSMERLLLRLAMQALSPAEHPLTDNPNAANTAAAAATAKTAGGAAAAAVARSAPPFPPSPLLSLSTLDWLLPEWQAVVEGELRLREQLPSGCETTGDRSHAHTTRAQMPVVPRCPTPRRHPCAVCDH